MNQIRYKFYSTKKKIPWLLGGENIHPTPDIQDSWFDFIQLPDNLQFNFITPFKSNIIVNDEKITYWKVEKYVNDVLDTTYYFYTSRILSFLRNGYKLELSLDIYLTYTKNIINKLLTSPRPVKINRGTITSKHLLKNNEETKTYIKCLKDIDSNVLNGEDTYTIIRPFEWFGCEEDNPSKKHNLFPFRCSTNLTYKEKDWGYFNNPTTINPVGGYWHNYSNVNERFRSVFDDGKIIYKDSEYYNQLSGSNPSTPEPNETQKEINKYIGSMFHLETVYKDRISPEEWTKMNDNVMNSYFFVFRTVEGYYDCYPIIGKIPVKVRVPSICLDSRGLPSTESNHNLTNTDRPVINRVYSNKFTTVDVVLDNDFESIDKDYREKILDYPSGSFQGVFRWVFPGGKDSKMCFSVKKYKDGGSGKWYPWIQKSNFRFSDNSSTTYTFSHTIPQRLMYRFKYSDVSNMFLRNNTSRSGYFELVSPDTTNLIDNYINLLQPVSIGLSEIVPLKYCFLSKKYGDNLFGYTIPFSYSFSSGFKGFLNTNLYNHPSLTYSFGGTLPVNTDKYDRLLEQIETQKNNGVFSSVGNLFSRPLNWLSGSFGRSWGSINQEEKGDRYVNELLDGKWYEKLHNRIDNSSVISTPGSRGSVSGNLGGIGGFIGDFINIDNTIRQSDIMKRNIGLGYITSLDDDLLSSISHYNFVKNMIEKRIPLLTGLYTVFGRKIFTDNTKEKYKNYFRNFGFRIGDILNSKNYIEEIINYVKQYGEIGFFQIDRDWSLMNLIELSDYTDNLVKNSIINQLSSGIRIKHFS